MKYSLDNRLIGVGVVDMLPGGFSSVYFFYDHSFKEYRLGVFSSLVEIEYIKYLNKAFPEFKYYYMGFYIQNCKKMNYKGKVFLMQPIINLVNYYVQRPLPTSLSINRFGRRLKTLLPKKLSQQG
jgi:arginyl-tRNA--protein-N-Asp/Glu arginylyltransferase